MEYYGGLKNHEHESMDRQKYPCFLVKQNLAKILQIVYNTKTEVSFIARFEYFKRVLV